MTDQPQPPSPSPAPAPALGSLAQSSRLGELKAARWILIILGIINLGFYAFMFSNAEKEVDTAIKKELAALGSGFVVDNAKVAELRTQAIGKVKVIYGFGIAIGFVFIACGFLVYKAPVPATLTGLIIYIAIIAAGAMFEPKTLAQGIILKIIIIVCLVKAVQAAFAYKREEDQMRLGAPAA